MSNKTNDNTTQGSPRSLRLWRENAIWLDGFCRQFSNFNAGLNIALMQARGCGDFQIEEACKEYQKRGKRYERNTSE